MVNRGEIIMLGLASGVSGGLIGGLMLGIGLDLVVQGVNVGWLLMIPAGPVSGVVGWILARRLAARLPTG